MNAFTRPHRDTVRLGDTCRVAGAQLDGHGVTITDRGWSGARVLRLIATREGVLAEVTVPGRAATRTVHADRLTRQRKGA